MLSIVIMDSIPFLWDTNGVCVLFRTADCMLRIVIGENFIGISNCANCSTWTTCMAIAVHTRDYVYCVMMKLSKCGASG